MITIDLSGRWQFRGEDRHTVFPDQSFGVTRWMHATVPGTVHTDLLAAGKIPDPFYRMNESDVQWIDTLCWVYRRTFDVPEAALREHSVIAIADGLDTVADISINGMHVCSTRNMFVAHRFDVKPALRPGKNTIEIVFDSPTEHSMLLEQEHGRLQVALKSHRVYVRKAQYSFGWDWGPTLTTSGIWRPLRIEAFSGPRLVNPCMRVVSLSSDSAEIELEVAVQHAQGPGYELQVRVTGEETDLESTVPVKGENVVVRQTLHNPRLWWPNGYGAQHLYTATIALRDNGQSVETLSIPFAVRTVRLVQEPDDDGRSFILEVNGTPIFCKGADWIPADSFLPRVSEATYTRLLTMARDASMNMVRIWGGGIYEEELFYDLCDRLGLMVWQDFMFACGEYPDHQVFLENVRREAEEVVVRLRNHPSVVLWCGNNECEWGFCSANPGKGPDDMRGATIFRDLLPAVVQQLDGTRPYWRSTPFGDGFPNDQDNGNHHQWEVWSMWKDFTEYRTNRARFVSEFGFQAPPDRRTLERVTLPEDRFPQSPVMQHHNKQEEGTERLFRFQAAHYAVATEWGDFFHTGQLVQAEALKCAVEHWRRRKFRTAGALFWQLNDCWPVTSWSVIDADLRPKAAYFYAQRFFAPVLVSFALHDSSLDVWGTNDTLEPVHATLLVELRSFTGKVLWRKKLRVEIPANDSRELFTVPPAVQKKADRATTCIYAALIDNGVTISDNRHFFLEAKHLHLLPAGLSVTVRKTGPPREYRALVRSKRMALGVFLATTRGDTFFCDNWFDLDAGGTKEVNLRSDLSLGALRRAFTVRCLNG